MDQCKLHAHRVCNGRRTLSATRVRADNDSLPVARDVALDVALQKRPAVEVVDRDIKVPLVLRVMQIHGDDVIGAGAGEQVGDQGPCLCNPLLVSRPRLERIDFGGG